MHSYSYIAGELTRKAGNRVCVCVCGNSAVDTNPSSITRLLLIWIRPFYQSSHTTSLHLIDGWHVPLVIASGISECGYYNSLTRR